MVKNIVNMLTSSALTSQNLKHLQITKLNKSKFVLGMVNKNIDGKWENAGYKHFLFFLQCFGIVW